jgi:hypothetical protein
VRGSCPRRFPAEPRQGIDPRVKIGRLNGDQDLHVGRDLEHHGTPQRPRERSTPSAVSSPMSRAPGGPGAVVQFEEAPLADRDRCR